MIDNFRRLIDKYSTFYDNISVCVTESGSKSVQLNGFELENIEVSDDVSVSVRAYKDGRLIAFGYDGSDTDFADASLRDHQKIISLLPEDDHRYIPAMADVSMSPEYDENIRDTDTGKLISAASDAVRAALDSDSRVKYVKQSSAEASEQKRTLISRDGLLSDISTYYSSSVYLIAESGTAGNSGGQDAYGVADSVYFSGLNHTQAAREAADKASGLLNPKRLRTAKYGILFTPEVMAEFLDLILELVNAENVYKNMSILAGKLGDKCASGLTLTDDPFIKRGTGSRFFDGEGQASQKTIIFNNGLLESYLHNSYTAKAMGMKNTANAVMIKNGNVGISCSNVKIDATTDKKPYDFMTEYVKVSEVMGMHTADVVSGDFSVGISGIYYRNGEPAHAFREAVLSGNLKDMLNSLIHIFDNHKTFGGITSAAALFDKMTVSGE